MAIVLNGSGTVTGVTNVGSAAANTPVVLQDSGSNTNTCRAWVNFNGTGTVAIRASFNVSSITDNGTGLYTVNFTTAMPDANYSTIVTASSNIIYANDGSGAACVNGNFTPTTSAVRVMTFLALNSPGNDTPSVYTNVAIFR
jgi:hypothetical protein